MIMLLHSKVLEAGNTSMENEMLKWQPVAPFTNMV